MLLAKQECQGLHKARRADHDQQRVARQLLSPFAILTGQETPAQNDKKVMLSCATPLLTENRRWRSWAILGLDAIPGQSCGGGGGARSGSGRILFRIAF